MPSQSDGVTKSNKQKAFAAKQELVRLVNNLNTTWKASLNSRFHDEVVGEAQSFRGCAIKRRPSGSEPTLRVRTYRGMLGNEGVPESFDARDQWKQCPTIAEVRDQSNCGSCWAFGATEAISDRICIASGGQEAPHISADDLLSCCSSCGFGCEGGDPSAAWEYWVKHGLVTGSNYTSGSGCKPYPFPPCEHHTTGRLKPCNESLQPTPKCDKRCQKNYTVSYEQDKHYGRDAYTVENHEKSIQKEIMTNGPVEASFDVYEDFEVYKSGVYQHVTGQYMGGHAVRMIGWGVDAEHDNVPYWLIVNSWNQDWGEKGLFRIKRGNNECGIEEGISAGLPKSNRILSYFKNLNGKNLQPF